MKPTLLFWVLVTGLATAVAAQPAPADEYRIEGRIRGLRDTTAVLAHYFGYNQYIPKDTARIDSTGRFVFSGKDLPGGLYMVIGPKNKRVELILFGASAATSKPVIPRFSFETDTVGLVAKMVVNGSPDNEAFYTYQQQMLRLGDEAKGIDLQMRFRNDGISRIKLRRELAELQGQARAFQQQFLTKNSTPAVSKLLRMMADPDVPVAPQNANGKIDSTFQYRYYKTHFWDNIDFADERLVRTPIFQRKIDRYLQDLTAPVVDSLIRSADLIVKKARANREVLSYAIWYITSQYERPRLMGTDGVFVHMAETYYLAGVMPAAAPTTVDNIRKRIETVKPLLVGKSFPTLAVSDTLKQPIDLKAIRADYTVLFFYDPTCTHCRASMPALTQFSQDSAAKGVQFCAIAVDNSPDTWQKFIREFGIQRWVNGYDFTFRNDYRRQYDVIKTPTVYVLDKDQTIIARALPAEQVAHFIQFQRRKK
ncbi:redoxin domain-containing protein [Fibrella sp. HMF5335]|uniref:Redoxin domain-containing protein n=1 Tax=Fibrella rubiginis TaxID=2817060 RepID=A0A939K5S2_9BACT|nr:thioredoxin-like domain-containing protein [Fibrella rubiginis]MBO0937541.1 redoxin domain-containing protein [Fibrella rubiginis]